MKSQAAISFTFDMHCTVHATTIAERSYAERAASIASSTVINLACNPRPHAITQRVLMQQKIVQQLCWHGMELDCKEQRDGLHNYNTGQVRLDWSKVS